MFERMLKITTADEVIFEDLEYTSNLELLRNVGFSSKDFTSNNFKTHAEVLSVVADAAETVKPQSVSIPVLEFVKYLKRINNEKTINHVKYIRTLVCELFGIKLSGEVYEVRHSFTNDSKIRLIAYNVLEFDNFWMTTDVVKCLYMLVVSYDGL